MCKRMENIRSQPGKKNIFYSIGDHLKSVISIKLVYLKNGKKFRNSKDKEFRMKAGE